MAKKNTKKGTTNAPRSRRKKRKPDFKRYAMIGFVLLATIAFIFSSIPSMPGGGKKPSTNNSTSNSASTTPSAIPTFKEEGSLAFKNTNGEIIRSIKMEVADDESQRTQGMMYRRSIPNDTGMLFIFPEEAPRSFWMKNTYVSLDIIFVDANNTIINIHENTATLSEQLYPSTSPAKYVVEVAGGFTAAYNIKAGDKIEFELM